MAEPLWVFPAYFYWFMGSAVLAGILMHWARRRWPTISNVRLVLLCYLVMVVFDFVIEILWLRMGMYSFVATIDWLTIFQGHYYQLPVYEVKIFAASMCAIACVRFFRDDKGYTVAERGVDQFAVGRRKKFALRYLALVGIINLCFLGYNVAFQWTGTHVTESPTDISGRSYLTNQICGAGSGSPAIACPGEDVPIPLPNSPRVTVDGTLAPPGE